MFIARLLDVVTQILNVPVSSPNLPGCEFLFDEIRLRDHPDELNTRKGLIGPLRGFVDCDFDMFDKIVAHLRDPRDVLVSLFFSWAYSHPVDAPEPELVNPQGELIYVTPELRESWRQAGPDAFALEFSPFIEYNLRLYCDRLISRKNVKVLFYEDLVANPMKWMRAFLLWFGAGEPDLNVFLSILQPLFAPEFAIGVEDHMAHRRQLLPGDHLRKLTAETVSELTRRFSFFLEWRRSLV